MIGNSLITQIGIIAVSVGIILTYIKPAFGDIKSTQDDIAKTEEQYANVKATNDLLKSLYDNLNAIPQANKNALFTYLPDTTDEVLVMKDLTSIAKDSEVFIKELSFEGFDSKSKSASVAGENLPAPQSFKIGLSSSYEQLKDFLQRLEQNNYPLVVDTLAITPTDSGLLDSDLTIITYSHK